MTVEMRTWWSGVLAARLAVVAVAALTMCGWSLPANAAWSGWMEVKGDTQGKLVGGGTGGQIRVVAIEPKVTHQVGSSAGAGDWYHRPVAITVAVDRATPLLMNAFVNNERLSKVVVHISMPAGGSEVARLELRNVRIVHFALSMDSRKAFERHSDDLLSLELLYDVIDLEWTATGVVYYGDARPRASIGGQDGAPAPPPSKSVRPVTKAVRPATKAPPASPKKAKTGKQATPKGARSKRRRLPRRKLR